MEIFEPLRKYKKDLVKKIKEKVSEVRKNEEELNEFLVRGERNFFHNLIDYLNFEYDTSNEELKKLVDEYIELNYKKYVVEKIKEKVSEVRKNEEELNEFLVRKESSFFII